jgi:predicted nucleic acid-binding protein
MKKVLIDTNIYSYPMKGDPETISVLRQSHKIGVCAVNIGELLSGFRGGNRGPENRKELEEFAEAV